MAIVLPRITLSVRIVTTMPVAMVQPSIPR